jgi:predicted NBD/HSP70 family sugar kinase
MLANNEIEMAGDQDIVLPAERLGLPFSLAFQSDLVGAVWISQLEPPIGKVSDELLEAMLALRHGEPVAQLLPYQGLPVGGSRDPRWHFKLEELAAMQALSASCTAHLLASSERTPPSATLGTILTREMASGAPQSPKEVANSTGLPETVVRGHVTRLMDEGFLIEDPSDPSMLRVNERRPSAIGISIRPDELVGMVTNLRATDVLPSSRRPLQGTEVSEVVDDVSALVRDLLEARPNTSEAVIGLGVELSGHVDGRVGEVVFSPDLKTAGDYWRNVPLAKLLREATGLDTVVENDANALALHEFRFGAGLGVDDFVVVLIGHRGVGAGVIAGGNLIHGRDGIAGEIGHWVMDPRGLPCRCGKQGCLETVVSAQAICDAIRAGSDLTPANLQDAAQGVEWKNNVALLAFERAGQILGHGLSLLFNLANSSQVILFGPPQLTDDHSHPSAKLFLEEVERTAKRFSFSFAAQRYELIPKSTDEALAAKGAASAVLDRMITGPKNGDSNIERRPRPRLPEFTLSGIGGQ